jgi:hypothetical protein
MIVERRIFVAKPHRADEMVEILQALWRLSDSGLTHRIYVPITGTNFTVHMEIEFKDLKARQAFWADSRSDPERDALMERWNELRDTGGTTEFLTLVE